MTIIDAHQHFWRLSRGDYRFPSSNDPVLYRDFLPEDLAPILKNTRVGHTVLVQATDTIEESHFLVHLAKGTPFVAGVVGWWDPREPEALDRLLDSPDHQCFVGVRPMLQRSDDVSWLLEAGALSDLSRIAAQGLALDALVEPRHLSTIVELGRAVPDLHIVVDHMGKPWRQPDRFEQWVDGMGRLAEVPNCWLKVSGFPLASAGEAEHLNLSGLLKRLRNLFGVSRLVWGSDWPVVEREGGYTALLNATKQHFSDGETEAAFGGNAKTLYRLQIAPSPGQDIQSASTEVSTSQPIHPRTEAGGWDSIVASRHTGS